MQFNIPAEYKNASGVYIIRNSVNSKVYVGSAVKLRRRYMAHLCGLKGGYHSNPHLQSFAKKNGTCCLSFELAELYNPACEYSIEALEQQFITLYDAANRERGFNIQPIVFPIRATSAETRQRMSAAAKKKGISDEQRQKMLAGRAGGRNRESLKLATSSCETCAKKFQCRPSAKRKYCSRECWYARPVIMSKEARESFSAARRGIPKSIESVAKRSETMRSIRLEKRGRNCQICGTLFAPQAGNKNARFCSKACWHKDLVLTGSPKKSLVSERQRICEYCGEAFLVAFPKKVQRFCSRSCLCKSGVFQNPLNKSLDIERQCNCQQCGTAFLVSSPSRKRPTCSKICANALRRSAKQVAAQQQLF